MKRNDSEIVKRGHVTKKAKGTPGPFTGKTHSDETNRISSERQRNERTNRRSHMLLKMEEIGVELLNDLKDDEFELCCKLCNHHFTMSPQYFQESKWASRKIQCQICKQKK